MSFFTFKVDTYTNSTHNYSKDPCARRYPGLLGSN